MDDEIAPYCHDWDEEKKLPKELFIKAAQAGILQGVVGGEWPSEYTSAKAPEGWCERKPLTLTLNPNPTP